MARCFWFSSGMPRSRSGRELRLGPLVFLSGLQGHLAAAHNELASIVHELSLKAASARVRRWRKWAQSSGVRPE